MKKLLFIRYLSLALPTVSVLLVVSAPTLARAGLRAYAAHPLFECVGLDRTFYGPMTREAFAGMAAQVPPSFRFVMKGLESSTVAVFPKHPRYGAEAGQPNPRFLDARAVSEELVRPAIDGLCSIGDRVGFGPPSVP